MKQKPDMKAKCKRCGREGLLWHVRFRYGVLPSIWGGRTYACEECCTSRPGRWKYASK